MHSKLAEPFEELAVIVDFDPVNQQFVVLIEQLEPSQHLFPELIVEIVLEPLVIHFAPGLFLEVIDLFDQLMLQFVD